MDAQEESHTATGHEVTHKADRKLVAIVVVLAIALMGVIGAIVVTVMTTDDATATTQQDEMSGTGKRDESASHVADTDGSADMQADQKDEYESGQTGEPSKSAVGDEVELDYPALQTSFKHFTSSGGKVYGSDVVLQGDQAWGIVAFADANDYESSWEWQDRLQVWKYVEAEWVEETTFRMELPVVGWETMDVTGDGTLDLILDLWGGNGTFGEVLTSHNGAWALAKYTTGEGGVWSDLGLPLVLEQSQLVAYENTCVPDCAAGNYIRYLLEWHDSGYFRLNEL